MRFFRLMILIQLISFNSYSAFYLNCIQTNIDNYVVQVEGLVSSGQDFGVAYDSYEDAKMTLNKVIDDGMTEFPASQLQELTSRSQLWLISESPTNLRSCIIFSNPPTSRRPLQEATAGS